MKSSFWLISLFTLMLSSSLSAEVLEMPNEEVISPDATTTQDSDVATPEAAPAVIDQPVSVTLPGRGMLKEQVEERFGAPQEKVQAVGEPPISSWVYNGFTVYFEYDHVIHSVHHK